MLGLIGMLVALALLVILAMRGWNILLIAIVCSAVVALTNGMNLYETLLDSYMLGYVGFFKSWFMMFLAGALFGKLMEKTRGAETIANIIVKKLGGSKAVLAIVISCAVLAYGGVSIFVIGFTIYPIAVSLFKEANLPRKFLPGAIGFGTVTFAMTSPGTPQIQNVIQSITLGTDTMSGAIVGIIAGIFMFIVGMWWLNNAIRKDVAKGGCFHEFAEEKEASEEGGDLPAPLVAFIPLIVTIVGLNVLKLKPEVSITISLLVGILALSKHLNMKELSNLFGDGASGAIAAIANTCAVVGFGSVVKSVPAFDILIDAVTHIPGPPLVGAAIAVTVVCGITGSASGGLGIAIPIVGPIYMAMGVPAAAIHRVTAIASGALDSLPHNGYIVTLLNICKTSHRDGYMPLFWLTVVLPAVACLLAIGLFQLFPNWV